MIVTGESWMSNELKKLVVEIRLSLRRVKNVWSTSLWDDKWRGSWTNLEVFFFSFLKVLWIKELFKTKNLAKEGIRYFLLDQLLLCDIVAVDPMTLVFIW